MANAPSQRLQAPEAPRPPGKGTKAQKKVEKIQGKSDFSTRLHEAREKKSEMVSSLDKGLKQKGKASAKKDMKGATGALVQHQSLKKSQKSVLPSTEESLVLEGIPAAKSQGLVKDSVSPASPKIQSETVESPSTLLSSLAAVAEQPRQAVVKKAEKQEGGKDKGEATVQPTMAKGDANSSLVTRTGRVEVEDKRIPIQELSGKHSRQKAVAKKGDSHVPQENSQATNAHSTRFAVAETDIDLSPRGGKVATESFSEQLARKLDAQNGNEIVRQVKVVVDRADAGEVRINLRPGNLGRVRVRIRMEDHRLTGRIFVESAAAREAFRSALDGLQTKLVESGFGAADLELAWDGQEGGNGTMLSDQRKGQSQQHHEKQAKEWNDNVPVVDGEKRLVADGHVNLVA
ncbi:MAG: flagellar hook-length control protein FliK [Spirochaetales bacterium]|nr:flagellar hook-length control protein FliK [Spirochaetales bacterium]